MGFMRHRQLGVRSPFLKRNSALFQKFYKSRVDRNKSYRLEIRIGRDFIWNVNWRPLDQTRYRSAYLPCFPWKPIRPYSVSLDDLTLSLCSYLNIRHLLILFEGKQRREAKCVWRQLICDNEPQVRSACIPLNEWPHNTCARRLLELPAHAYCRLAAL